MERTFIQVPGKILREFKNRKTGKNSKLCLIDGKEYWLPYGDVIDPYPGFIEVEENTYNKYIRRNIL